MMLAPPLLWPLAYVPLPLGGFRVEGQGRCAAHAMSIRKRIVA